MEDLCSDKSRLRGVDCSCLSRATSPQGLVLTVYSIAFGETCHAVFYSPVLGVDSCWDLVCCATMAYSKSLLIGYRSGVDVQESAIPLQYS